MEMLDGKKALSSVDVFLSNMKKDQILDAFEKLGLRVVPKISRADILRFIKKGRSCAITWKPYKRQEEQAQTEGL